jgi:hypothetical protein
LPPGLRVAGVPVRFGAWMIDSVITGLISIGMVLVAAAAGAIGINPAAESQLQNAPLAIPTVAPYVANLPLLAVFAASLVVVNVVYVTVLLARFRGLPGQRMLSLQVGDAVTGRNLSWRRAFVRAVMSIGIPSAGATGFLYSIVALESSVPWSEIANPQPGGAAETWLASWAGPIMVAILAFIAWPVVLLVWTASSSTRQGLHDIAARSQVVGRAPARAGFGFSAGQMPGYTAAYPAHQSADAAPVSPGDPESQPPLIAEPVVQELDRAPLWTRVGNGTDTPSRLRGATMGRRTAAYLMDCVVIYAAFSLLQAILLVTLLKSATPADSSQVMFDERTSILIGLLGGVLQLVYFVPGWAIWRGTVCQRLLHLEVADVTTGKALGWMDAFLRWTIVQGPIALVTIVPQAARTPVLFMATVWMFYLQYSTQNNRLWQGLHDRFVNSRVGQEP